MRIGLIAPPWLPVPPVAYGGTEAVIDRLACGLQRAGHDVVLAATGDSTCPVPRIAASPTAFGVGAQRSERRHVMQAYAGLRGCDVVHDHTLCGPQLAASTHDSRVVTTHHGEFSGELLELYTRIADRVPIVAISCAQAATAPGVPIARVIHHGVDIDHFPRGHGKGGYFLFLGRMAPEKGAHRAARIAREANVPLLIAAKMSEPQEQRYFEEQVVPLLGEGVVYLGEVREREKIALLADARALINPIRWAEPFGLVMIEALSCGTPVLAFAEGAAPEVIDHGVTGFLCADEEDLGARLAEVRGIDRAACRDSARDRFSTERMVRNHLELYELIAEGMPVTAPRRELVLVPGTGRLAQRSPSTVTRRDRAPLGDAAAPGAP